MIHVFSCIASCWNGEAVAIDLISYEGQIKQYQTISASMEPFPSFPA